MAIKNMIGDTASTVSHTVQGGISEFSARLSNALSGATAQLGSLWDGGFVGIDASNINVLTTDIENYVQALMAISDNFAKTNDISGALKGTQGEAAQEYVSAIASLIDAYCSTYRNFNAMALNAVESMQAGDAGNAQSIRDEAQNILSEAASIRVD